MKTIGSLLYYIDEKNKKIRKAVITHLFLDGSDCIVEIDLLLPTKNSSSTMQTIRASQLYRYNTKNNPVHQFYATEQEAKDEMLPF